MREIKATVYVPLFVSLQEREAHEVEVDELNGLLEDKYSQVKNTDEKNRENAKASIRT